MVSVRVSQRSQARLTRSSTGPSPIAAAAISQRCRCALNSRCSLWRSSSVPGRSSSSSSISAGSQAETGSALPGNGTEHARYAHSAEQDAFLLLPFVLPGIQLGIGARHSWKRSRTGSELAPRRRASAAPIGGMVAPPSRSRRLSAGEVVVWSGSAVVRLLEAGLWSGRARC